MLTYAGIPIPTLADLAWPTRRQLLRRLEAEIRAAVYRDQAIHQDRAARRDTDAVEEILATATAPRQVALSRHLAILAETSNITRRIAARRTT